MSTVATNKVEFYEYETILFDCQLTQNNSPLKLPRKTKAQLADKTGKVILTFNEHRYSEDGRFTIYSDEYVPPGKYELNVFFLTDDFVIDRRVATHKIQVQIHKSPTKGIS